MRIRYLAFIPVLSVLLFTACEDQEYDQEISAIVATNNIPDYHDQNEVPGELEERQNEDVNLTDPVDTNTTPDVMEERQQEEEWRQDYENEQFDAPPGRKVTQ